MPLFDLPIEILQDIAQTLPYTSVVALRWSCSYLYTVLDGQPPPRWKHIPPASTSILDAHRHHFTDLRPSSISADNTSAPVAVPLEEEKPYTRTFKDQLRCVLDLLTLETWPCFDRAAQELIGTASPRPRHTLFACPDCLKLRPMNAFAIGQTKGRHAKATPMYSLRYHMVQGVGPRNKRICLQCGVKRGLYTKGVLLQFAIEPEEGRDGVCEGTTKTRIGIGIVCKRCGEYKVTGAETRATLRRTCEECLAYRPP